MPPNSFSDLFGYITQLMTQDAAMFEAMGTKLYASFTVILVVWFGIEWAFAGGMRMERFVNMMLMISFGYVAAAVCVLLGPILIPFFIVPKMEWVFWGWLRALLQYSFYPVVANAYVYVFGSMLINFVDKAGTDFSGPRVAVLFVPFLFLLFAFTFGLLKVPSLVNSIFSGKSGESVVPGL